MQSKVKTSALKTKLLGMAAVVSACMAVGLGADAQGQNVLVIQGGLALGSALWGVIAEWDIAWSLAIAAGLSLLTTSGVVRWRLAPREKLDLRVTDYWPQPIIHSDMPADRGPVLIIVTYDVQEGREDAFVSAMPKVKRVRHRTGATRWGLYQDSAIPTTFVETFMVSSWEEHLRQHARTTATDQRVQSAAYEFLRPGTGPVTQHLLWAYDSDTTIFGTSVGRP